MHYVYKNTQNIRIAVSLLCNYYTSPNHETITTLKNQLFYCYYLLFFELFERRGSSIYKRYQYLVKLKNTLGQLDNVYIDIGHIVIKVSNTNEAERWLSLEVENLDFIARVVFLTVSLYYLLITSKLKLIICMKLDWFWVMATL